MDGSNLRILVNTTIKWPNGVAFDMPSERVFWGDAFYDLLESVRLDGTHRVSVRPSLPIMSVHPFSISVFEENIYWTDSGVKEVQRCHKFTGENHTVVIKSSHVQPNAVQIISPVLFPGDHFPCSTQRCDQFCLIKEGGLEGTCLCGTAYNLVDNRTCVLKEYLGHWFMPRNPFNFTLKGPFNIPAESTTLTSRPTTESSTTTATTTVDLTTNAVVIADEQEERREIIITSEIIAHEPKDNTSLVVGVVIGIALFVLFCGAVLFWIKKRNARKADDAISLLWSSSETSGITNPRSIEADPKQGLFTYSSWEDNEDNHPDNDLR